MTKLNHIFGLLALGFCFGLGAQTLQAEPSVLVQQRAAALTRLDRQVHPASAAKALPMAEALVLLQSTEGPAWHVYRVHGPVCSKAMGRKECRIVKKDCAVAKSFAKKKKVPVSCSALVSQTTVMVSTAKALALVPLVKVAPEPDELSMK